MKLYRYRLGLDNIIEKIDNVKKICDRYYIDDENEEHLESLCDISSVDSGFPDYYYSNEWLCYSDKQSLEDLKFDLTNFYNMKLISAREQVKLINAKIQRLDEEILMLENAEVVAD